MRYVTLGMLNVHIVSFTGITVPISLRVFRFKKISINFNKILLLLFSLWVQLWFLNRRDSVFLHRLFKRYKPGMWQHLFRIFYLVSFGWYWQPNHDDSRKRNSLWRKRWRKKVTYQIDWRYEEKCEHWIFQSICIFQNWEKNSTEISLVLSNNLRFTFANE